MLVDVAVLACPQDTDTQSRISGVRLVSSESWLSHRITVVSELGVYTVAVTASCHRNFGVDSEGSDEESESSRRSGVESDRV